MKWTILLFLMSLFGGGMAHARELSDTPQDARISEYVRGLEDAGWTVRLGQHPVTGLVEIKAEKVVEDAEEQGILKVLWDNKYTVELKYAPVAEGIRAGADQLSGFFFADAVPGRADEKETPYRLYDFAAYREHKAPLFGQWRKVETLDTVPQWPGLKGPPLVAVGFAGL